MVQAVAENAAARSVNIHDALDATLNAVSDELRNKIDVRREYGRVPQVKCHPQYLARELKGIVRNAAGTISDQRAITVRTWSDATSVYVEIGPDSANGLQDSLARGTRPLSVPRGHDDWDLLGLIAAYNFADKPTIESATKHDSREKKFFLIQLPASR